jgi:putative transposase
MGRKPRIYFPGACYHVINRGNQCRRLYYTDRDYQTMLSALEAASERYQLRIHSYCLMPNHFHLVAEVADFALGQALRSIETRYASYFNQRHRKTGHVFQGRYRAILIDKPSYLLELTRYIHLNPVRAGLVSKPEEWLWSSHRTYVGWAGEQWLYRRDILSLFGKDGTRQLVEYLEQARDLAKHPEYYKPERYPVLGGEKLLQMIPQGQEPSRRASASFPGHRLGLDEIIQGIAAFHGVAAEQVLEKGKKSMIVSRIREEIVLAAIHYFSYPSQKVAVYLRVSASAITRIQRRALSRLMSDPSAGNAIKELLLTPEK